MHVPRAFLTARPADQCVVGQFHQGRCMGAQVRHVNPDQTV